MLKSFCLALLSCALLSSAANADEWVSLFNGKSLEGWTQKNGYASYRVEDGAIVGTTAEGSPNSFLCSLDDYHNFELEFDVKVADELNSGCQIRSKTKDVGGKSKEKFGRVYGPQVEIEASNENGAEAGYVYGEATGRGWLTPEDKLVPHKHMNDGEWNHFRIVANGANIKTWINDEMVSDLTDEAIYETHPKGFIGLQVHGIKKETGPYEVSWKNIKIKVLD